MDRNLGPHVQGIGKRDVRLRYEWRRNWPRLTEKHRCPEESRLAGGRRNLPRRNQRILEVAGNHARSNEDDQHDRLSSSLRWLCRKRRFHDEFVALAAVEECCSSSAR